jgi:hypothetical protein
MELVLIGIASWAASALGVVCLCRAAARGDAAEVVPYRTRPLRPLRPRNRSVCAAGR